MAKQKNTTGAVKAAEKQTTLSLLLPIVPYLIIAAVIPLIVHMALVDVPVNIRHFWTNNEKHMDFFSYNKAITFIVISGLTLCCFIGSKLMKLGATVTPISLEDRTLWQKLFYQDGELAMERVLFVPMGIYTLFTLLSTLFSGEYFRVALMGFPDRYEGLWVLLGYVAVWFCLMFTISDVKQIHWIVTGIVISGVIMSIIGITQYIGQDFFQTTIGQMIMVPEKYIEMRGNMKFNFGAKSIYATLFNPNNVGSMMAMLTLLGLSLTILLKNTYAKLCFAVFTALVGFSLLGSNSRGGFIGLIVGVLCLVVLLLIAYKFSPKYLAIGAGVLGLIAVILVAGSNIFPNLKLLSLDSLLGQPAAEFTQTAPVATTVGNIKVEDNTATLITDAGDLRITYISEGTVTLSDSTGAALPFTQTGSRIVIEDPRFASVDLDCQLNQFKATLVHDFVFAYEKDDMLFMGQNGFFQKPIDAPSIAFLDKYGYAGSSRFAIWSQTIPMMKDTLLIGHGADTYAMYYPQNDYESKLKYYNTPFMMVDKAHNQYLQIAVNQGVLSLCGFLAALALYFYWSVKSIFSYGKKAPKEAAEQTTLDKVFIAYNIAFASAMMAYLGAAMFNDSIVSVAPVFWTIWGLGCGLNILYRKAQKTQQ